MHGTLKSFLADGVTGVKAFKTKMIRNGEFDHGSSTRRGLVTNLFTLYKVKFVQEVGFEHAVLNRS